MSSYTLIKCNIELPTHAERIIAMELNAWHFFWLLWMMCNRDSCWTFKLILSIFVTYYVTAIEVWFSKDTLNSFCFLYCMLKGQSYCSANISRKSESLFYFFFQECWNFYFNFNFIGTILHNTTEPPKMLVMFVINNLK